MLVRQFAESVRSLGESVKSQDMNLVTPEFQTAHYHD